MGIDTAISEADSHRDKWNTAMRKILALVAILVIVLIVLNQFGPSLFSG
jgi:hypothetical protein